MTFCWSSASDMDLKRSSLFWIFSKSTFINTFVNENVGIVKQSQAFLALPILADGIVHLTAVVPGNEVKVLLWLWLFLI